MNTAIGTGIQKSPVGVKPDHRRNRQGGEGPDRAMVRTDYLVARWCSCGKGYAMPYGETAPKRMDRSEGQSEQHDALRSADKDMRDYCWPVI